ncbi:MEDS domain-containing protein [Natronococcus wangiae]|uniref:MEDS domain-containing protein n=1 Tax=Natronococcus wangiae TaxID=3068275 RepID=UPI00273DFA01|nr:MEDS domain-containing protein [Natronococcus sp. AD5]
MAAPSSPTLSFRELEADDDHHDHFALLYETRSEQFAVAVPFVKRGLERGERVIYAVSQNSRAAVAEALRDGGVAVDAARESGALSLVDLSEIYRTDDEFVAEEVLADVEMLVADLDEDRYAGIRLTADMTELLERGADPGTLLAYESAADDLHLEMSFVSLCQYDRTRLPPAVAEGIVRHHPLLGYRETVGPNAYYRSSDAEAAGSRVELGAKLEAHREKVTAVSESRQQERGITALSEATQQLREVEGDDIPSVAAGAARRAIDAPLAAFWRYEPAEQGLELAAISRRATGDVGDLSRFSGQAWESFVSHERTRRDVHDSVLPDADVRRLTFVPVTEAGVLAVATERPDGLTEYQLRITRILATAVHVSFVEAAKDERLETKREELERLRTVNALVQQVLRAVVDGSTRDEIETRLCESVTALDPFAFAWVGEVDPNAAAVTPRSWAGTGQEYLTDVLTAGVSGPATAAARSDETYVVPAVADDLHTDEWCREAVGRGFRSVASVPIADANVSYGVLTVYATQPTVFTESLSEVLDELGTLVGQRITMVEQEAAFRARDGRTLELELTASNFPFVQLAAHAGCTLEVEDLVVKDDDRVLAVATVADASRDRVSDAVGAAVTIDSGDVVHETADTYLLDLVFTQPFVGAALANRGAVLESITATPTAARLVVSEPEPMDGRLVPELIADRYPKLELLARREDRSRLATSGLPAAALRERLTDRQLQVLRTAYHAGYFESPRQCTGDEVAAALDISSQGFYQHMRRIQRTLIETVLEEP